jgi:hypothetical protein
MDGAPVFTQRMSAYRMEESEAFRVRLSRSIRRHGGFTTKGAAVAYVAAALSRMEHRLDKHHSQERDGRGRPELVKRQKP